MNPRSSVLVTGAAGCAGTLLVQELLAAGCRVVATDRAGAPEPPPHPELTWRTADLTDPAAAASLVAGVQAVVHTAALVDISLPLERHLPINLDAVRWLYEAARAAGVAHFVHLSTCSLYAPKDGPLREDDPLSPTSPYEEAKLLAEDFLRSRPADGPRVNILRPALIYGPRGRVLVAALATLPDLFRGLGRFVPRLSGGPRTNLVHALDVARAAVHLLEHPQPHGAAFNVSPPEALSAGEILDTAFAAGDLPPGRLRIPYPCFLVKAVMPLLRYRCLFSLLNRLLRRPWEKLVKACRLRSFLAPRVDMEAVVYLAGDTVFDGGRLQATGFTYRYDSFARGWAETIRWYRDNQWLPAAR